MPIPTLQTHCQHCRCCRLVTDTTVNAADPLLADCCLTTTNAAVPPPCGSPPPSSMSPHQCPCFTNCRLQGGDHIHCAGSAINALGRGEFWRCRDRKDKDSGNGCGDGDALGRANVQVRARAADGPLCARRSAWRSGKKGEEEVDNDDDVQPYFGNAREGVAWATPLQTQPGGALVDWAAPS